MYETIWAMCREDMFEGGNVLACCAGLTGYAELNTFKAATHGEYAVVSFQATESWWETINLLVAGEIELERPPLDEEQLLNMDAAAEVLSMAVVLDEGEEQAEPAPFMLAKTNLADYYQLDKVESE